MIGKGFTTYEERNRSICTYYGAGHTLAETAAQFGLGRQRTQQILVKGGVWNPPPRKVRTDFLGVNVKPDVKDRLRQRAIEAGKSVSQYVAEKLEGDLGGGER